MLHGLTDEDREDRDDLMLADHMAGRSLRDIGADWELSGERVRQILLALGYRDGGNSRRAKNVAAARQLTALADAMRRAKPCPVCGCWNVRGGRRPSFLTCSPGCADLWRVVRYHLDEGRHERHRVHCAASILKKRENYSPSLVALSEKIVAGGAPQPNRRYVVPGSKTHEALKRIGAA